MKKSISLKALVVVMSIVVYACGSSGNEKEVFDPIGKWDYKVTTDVSYGVITISGHNNTYVGSMTTEVFGNLEITNLKIVEGILTGDLDVAGTPATIQCEFNGDKFKGEVVAGETTFPMVGQRSEE